jgi:acetyl esterase/lipase
MTSRHLVDPDLQPLLDESPAITMTPEVLAQVRARFAEAFPPGSLAGDDNVAVDERRIPGPADAPALRVVVYAPRAAGSQRPALLHLHGGGYVMGAPEMSDARNRRLALQLDCVIVSVDYRLAPDAPFPGGLEDAYAALVWLHANAKKLAVDPARIAVGGESAGGGLSAGLALLARDRGEVPLLFQLLIYPTLDDRTNRRSDPHPYTGEFIWSRESNAFSWSSLLDGSDAPPEMIASYAVPARASNLSGLPPAYIAVGALDLYLEENIEYARRLTRAGVATELHVYPGAFHGFDGRSDAPIGHAFTNDYIAALGRAFSRKSMQAV